MAGRVAGKGIVITGAGSGMGRAIALGLAAEGATIGVADIDAAAAARTVSAIVEVEGAPPALALPTDVTDRSQVAAALDAFVDHADRLDVMFNNAGLNRPMRLLDVTEENWRTILDVNSLGVLIGIQEAAKRMIPRGGGKIVNTSSIAGRQGYPNFAPYCASKFAVNALTQAAARGLAEFNITCTAFAPGVVDTPLWDRLDADLIRIGESETPGQAMADFAAGIILGRPAAVEDIIGTALFLASGDSDYITGQTIMVDGGMVLV